MRPHVRVISASKNGHHAEVVVISPGRKGKQESVTRHLQTFDAERMADRYGNLYKRTDEGLVLAGNLRYAA